MTKLDVMIKKQQAFRTATTGHNEFDRLGYLPLENLWDAEDLICPCARKNVVNTIITVNPLDNFNHIPEEGQVNGSTSRYWYPPYRQIHTGIRFKITKNSRSRTV